MMRAAVAGSIALAISVGSGVSSAQTLAKLGFHNVDDRLFFGDGDWAPGFTKGECGGATPILVGVSRGMACSGGGGWFPPFCAPYDDAILCASAPSISVNYDAGVTLTDFFGTYFDDRLDTSWGDWAPGFAKMECGPTQVMTALAQTTGTGTEVTNARCSPAAINGATDCAAVPYINGDNREPPTFGGDWDYGYVKGQCGPGRYVKGVAQTSFIFCCTPF